MELVFVGNCGLEVVNLWFGDGSEMIEKGLSTMVMKHGREWLKAWMKNEDGDLRHEIVFDGELYRDE